MKNVKKVCVVNTNYEVDGQNNITSEMRELWEREHTAVLDILRNNGIVAESDAVEKNDWVLNIDLSKELSFSKSVEIVELVESRYDVEKFCFQAVYDDWNDEEPNLLIWLKTK